MYSAAVRKSLYQCPVSHTCFIILTQRNYRNVSLKDDTYETLKQMGDLTESFDDVVKRLIIKAASAQQPLSGKSGSITAAPLQPGGNNG